MDSNHAPEETGATEDALEEETKRPIQRWSAILAMVVIAAAYSEVSEGLAFVPRIVIPAAVLVGILLIWLALMRARHFLIRPVALGLIEVITLAEIASTLLLVSVLPRGAMGPTELLRDAALIWVINVVTFALWYWEIDGGGPLVRRDRPHEPKDFLFPQRAQGEQEVPGLQSLDGVLPDGHGGSEPTSQGAGDDPGDTRAHFGRRASRQGHKLAVVVPEAPVGASEPHTRI